MHSKIAASVRGVGIGAIPGSSDASIQSCREISDAIVSLLLECNDHVSVMIRMLNMDLDSRFDSQEIIKT